MTYAVVAPMANKAMAAVRKWTIVTDFNTGTFLLSHTFTPTKMFLFNWFALLCFYEEHYCVGVRRRRKITFATLLKSEAHLQDTAGEGQAAEE